MRISKRHIYEAIIDYCGCSEKIISVKHEAAIIQD